MMLIRASDAANSFGWAIPAILPQTHFCDVSGQGVKPYVTDGNTAWPRVPMNQKTADAENLFDGPSNWYVVPETGLYLINASFRPPDGSGKQYEFGFGVHTAQGDGPHFLWTFRPNASRYTASYARIAKCTAGDKLRMFIYTDYQVWEQTVSTAAMQIGMISNKV
ncbi:hypothetical protein [Methylobacterium sp. Leaf361]|uniref:hypothetical protein n=1 Tax=Methylobacterium sp. Leaf361 TaxID=1736352 RepID=UPI0012FECEE0|nr:hypothetical protein [Methylobacterium sp. Leaf361]